MVRSHSRILPNYEKYLAATTSLVYDMQKKLVSSLKVSGLLTKSRGTYPPQQQDVTLVFSTTESPTVSANGKHNSICDMIGVLSQALPEIYNGNGDYSGITSRSSKYKEMLKQKIAPVHVKELLLFVEETIRRLRLGEYEEDAGLARILN
ncbi:hypothetical protein GOV05_05110 [Candidatus Woesearchaeota archaeon]|nr:hypothetical protein [Candidatus Woesearchaeota archaeon]